MDRVSTAQAAQVLSLAAKEGHLEGPGGTTEGP